MLSEASLMDKLYQLPQIFKEKMHQKDYPGAKACYNKARTVALFLEIDEAELQELFGERGERGAVIQRGLFPEEMVQEAYRECIKTNQTRENSIYRPL